MNCSRFRSRLHAIVEERSAPRGAEPELRDHLANCEDTLCRDAWYELCLLDQAIGDWAAGFPELDFADRVVNELRSSPSGSASKLPGPAVAASKIKVRPVGGGHGPGAGETRHRGTSRWAVVSVALIVLVSSIAILTSSKPAQQGLVEPGSVAENSTPGLDDAPPAHEAPAVPFGPAERELAEVQLSSAYLGLAEGATRFLTDTVALTLAGEEDIENPTAAAELIHQARDRMGPWGDEFDAALDRFLGTLPDSESS